MFLATIVLLVDQEVGREPLHVVKPEGHGRTPAQVADRDPRQLLLLHGGDPQRFRRIDGHLVDLEPDGCVGIFPIEFLQIGVQRVARPQVPPTRNPAARPFRPATRDGSSCRRCPSVRGQMARLGDLRREADAGVHVRRSRPATIYPGRAIRGSSSATPRQPYGSRPRPCRR